MAVPDTAGLTRKQALGVLAGALGAAVAAPVLAQTAEHGDHDAMGGMMMAPDTAPSTAAYEEAAMRMHAAMDIAYTGNADVDFVRGMIAHHQGAIDMARVVIEYGSDPDIRQLAEAIIAAQEQEIVFMQQWLDAHPG